MKEMDNMNGIMILNTIAEPVYSFGWNDWCWFLLVPIFLAIYLIYFWSINRRHTRTRRWAWLGVLILIISMAVGYGVCSTENVTTKYSYQVLLDNTVDMVEFRQNYEILDQVGITYVIRQK